MVSWVLHFAVLCLGGSALAAQNLSECEQTINEKRINKGSLFSAFSVERPFRDKWERLYPTATKTFPLLKMTTPQDLHITVFYFGSKWNLNSVESIKSLVQFSDQVQEFSSKVQMVEMGANQNVIALGFLNFPSSLKLTIQKNNHALNKAALKRPDQWDDDFEAHISLAESVNSKPSNSERSQLALFKKWINSELKINDLQIQISPSKDQLLMLSGATRTDTSNSYVLLDEFLRANCGAQ